METLRPGEVREAVIPRKLLDKIAAHARDESPREVCGWLAGEAGEVHGIYPVPNAARDPEREFVMEPRSQIDTMNLIREAGLELLGTYHSHPKTPPVPSERDMNLALYPDIMHLIVSLERPGPEFACWSFACWRITEDGYYLAKDYYPAEEVSLA